MIRRLYVHGFRCLVNFELDLSDLNSVLIVGKNGAGKSSVRDVLTKLKRLADGYKRMRDVFTRSDLTLWSPEPIMRFEIEAFVPTKTGVRNCKYVLALEWPDGFKEFRVIEESLYVEGKPVLDRTREQVKFHKDTTKPVSFPIDWHQSALAVTQEPSSDSDLGIFKGWLTDLLVLAPVPSNSSGESEDEYWLPEPDMSDFAEWFRGLTVRDVSAGGRILAHLRALRPDLQNITNAATGAQSRRIEIVLEGLEDRLSFDMLSDGEKCLVYMATVRAWAEGRSHSVCFWDEPDIFISLSDVDEFITGMRQTFSNRGQVIVTSHNAEAIRVFTRETTIVFHRDSWTSPTRARLASDISGLTKDVATAMVRGELAELRTPEAGE